MQKESLLRKDSRSARIWMPIQAKEASSRLGHELHALLRATSLLGTTILRRADTLFLTQHSATWADASWQDQEGWPLKSEKAETTSRFL